MDSQANPTLWRDIAVAGMYHPVASGTLSTFGYHVWEVPVSNVIPNHVERGIDLLITQFRKKRPENSDPNPNNLIELLTGFLNQVQQVEYVESDLLTLRFLDYSVGIQLDGIGEIVGELRNGRNDTDYRIAIKFRIYINRSSGEAEVLIAFVKDFTNATVVRLQEVFPAGIYIFTNGTNVIQNFDLKAAIEQLMAAGVKLRGLFYLDPDSTYFTFDWDGLPIDPGYKGFDELDYLELGQHVGGQLFELIT